MNTIKYKYFLLLILPIVYIILAGVFFVYWRSFYIIGPDPVYSYLFTGMTLANGNIEIGYIDHPGITVQCFSAAVMYVQHLFNHSSVALYQDVLMHPESYLYVLCTAFGILYSLITLATGYYVFKRTGNIVMALLFQATPLLGKEILSASSPIPESFMIISGMLFMAYIYCNSIFIDSSEHPNKPNLRQVVIYAIFSGFMVATKYTCLPLAIIVLFLLPTGQLRLRYLGLCILFFLVFISPALPALGKMVQWVTGLATHKGIYGQGDKGFVDTSEFFTNFGKIFKEDIYFTSLYVLMIISLVVALLKPKQLQEKSNIYIRLLSGIFVSSSLLIVLVAKHYSFHYVVPIRLCFPLIIVGSYGILKDVLKAKILQKRIISLVAFYSFFTFLVIYHLEIFYTYPPKASPTTTADFLNKYQGIPIIMNADFGSSRIEPALNLGTSYTRDFCNKYWEFLKRMYPNSYLYNQSQGIIAHWDDIVYSPELFSKYPKAVIYFVDKDSSTRSTVLTNLCMWGTDTIVHWHLAYGLKESNEYIYELEGNQSMAKTLMANPIETDFDFDKLTLDKSNFISKGGKDSISVSNVATNEEHHSGNYSILMNKKKQYALNYIIRAFPGNIVNVSIWRKSDDGRGAIVFTSKTNGDFYSTGHAVIDSDANGWKKIEYKCLVPPSIKDSSIFFYLYYYGHGYAYFDDLSIKVYPMKK